MMMKMAAPPIRMLRPKRDRVAPAAPPKGNTVAARCVQLVRADDDVAICRLLAPWRGSRCVLMMAAPLIQGAQFLNFVCSSALNVSWIQVLYGPCPKEGAKLAELTPTAPFE